MSVPEGLKAITYKRALSPVERAACLSIRHVVFVEGQNVPPDEEIDGCDDHCLHYIGLAAQKGPFATARVLPMDRVAKIQRVAVLQAFRGGGYGRGLMKFILDDLRRANLGHTFNHVVLGAQLHALGFYERLGFVAYGPVYDDAGIEHRDMRLDLL